MEAEKKDAKAVKMATGWERGADGKEQTYENGMFEQMVESGVLKRAQKTEEPSEAKVDLTDNQGNPVNDDGTLKVEADQSVDELTDEDFSAPTRNVQLPALPQNVDAALNANGKPVIIKKNIFKKNWGAHGFYSDESRAILKAALYNTDLVGQRQSNDKPLHWVAIRIDDESPTVVLEVNENKDNIEIVDWFTVDERESNRIYRIKKQAEKNGGELVMLSPKDKVESLSTPQTDLSSESKGTEQSSSVQVDVSENAPMPMRVVGKGKNAAQEEDWLATTPKRGHDYVFKESGLDAEEANAFVENKVAEAEKNLEKVKGKAPKMGTNIAAYKEAKADYEARVAEAQKAVDYWHAVKAERDKVLLEERRARKEKDKALYDDAVAQEEQRKAEMAQKAAEQEALGSNAVAPAIKEKWENAPKVDGGADEITLPNGEVVTGHYVLTESGAASASHQATNGFAETEGYPVDVNGETVNDRDYKRDAEAQQVTRGMAADYDSRALQSPVVVSGDGVVLSGNGRTMAGEIAALNGSDAKYNAYLRGHAGKFGFTAEQVEGFKHPRVVFVPDGEMPYTSETFAKFNQREQKSQSRTEMAVKLGKVVDDALFGRVMDVIGRHESLAEFYADDAATAAVVKELADAGVIPQTEMAQLFDGGRLSESGQAMVEGVLVGKVFQGSPDAVRQITEVKSMRKAVMAALPEVVACHRLGGGYDLSKELAAAVDLVYKARKAGFKLGQHVSQHARQGNLFQLDDGATVADYNNAAVMMLADVMNDGRVTQLKKVLSFYNTQAADSAQGIGDMFAGGVKSKGQIINEVNELLNNGQEYDRRTPSVADGQGVGGEGGEQGDVAGPSHQGGAGSERGLSEAFDGLAAQLKTAEGEERKRVLGEMRDGIARFAEENGYPVPEFLLTREDFLAAVPEKDRAKYVEMLEKGMRMPAYYENKKVYYFVEGCDNFDKDVAETLAHEYTHADNAEFPENVNAIVYAVEDTHEVSQDELVDILEKLSDSTVYEEKAEQLEAEGKNANPMLADEVIAHSVGRMVVEGEQALDGITKNPTLQFFIKRAYKERENERQHNLYSNRNAERADKTVPSSGRNSSDNEAVAGGTPGDGQLGGSSEGDGHLEGTAERGRSAVSEGKEVAAPSSEGAKVGVTDGEKSSATGDAVPSGKGDTPLSEKIATASAEVNTEPTEAQKEAGNYKKGHVQVSTFDITIEQPQGSVRKGTDADGKQWESKMNNTYGYIRGAVGVDGDHIDVFLSNDIDGWNGRKVFVVDQYNPDGSFDEHKVMLGFNDADEAKSDYLANYENGWENGRIIDVTAVNLEDFEKWIASSKRKTKPFGEYSSVKNGVVENNAPVNEDTPSEIQTLLRERECTPISQEHRNLTDEGVVADNAGNPITLYHGTLDKSISVSELEAGHKRADGESADFAGSGVYFTPNKDVAEEYGYNGQVFEAHIKLSKPFYMLGNPGFNESEAVQFSNLLKSKGYDGIINYMNAWSVEHNMIDGGQVVVFNNSSILPIEKGQNNHAAYSITPSTYTNKKGESVEWNEVLEYEKALDHLEDVEQKWGDKIQNYVFEHYPTQATTSAESTSEKGLQERKAMKADPVLKQMYAEAKKEIDAADEMVTQKYSALPEDLRQQKAVGKSAQPPTREESILRDVVIEHMKGSGLDVIGTEDGQRVLDMVNDDGAKEHRVYHGSGAEFDHFDHSHMGEGEGAQAYGWGTYVTEVRGIGEGYAIRSKNGISMSREEWSLKRSELESNIYRAKEQLPFLKGEYKAEVEAQISEWEEQLKDYEPHKYLYTVEIPDDNGGNYLDWNGPVPAETIDRITEYLREKYGDEVVNGRWLSNPLLSSKGVDVSARNGAAIYRQLERALGSDKKASQLLSSLGYAGIKYPAEFRSGGRKDGAQNYVIFNENDAEITDHVRFFKTKNGEAYGFTVGGKIYYDPRIANAETPVHEYAHLWASALKANNAEEWKNVVDLMKGTNVWEEVKKTYPELETDDEIADEVLATYSGRRGAERLREEMRKAAAEGDGVMGKAEAVSALQRVKRAIDKFWKAVADFLHIHYTSAEEVADRVMKDLLDGVDPRSMMDGGKSLRPETRVNVVEAEAGHGFKNYAEAKTWAKEHIARTYSGEETGGKGDIRISNAAVDKYLSQSAVDKSESKDVHLAVLKVLPDVIRESVDAEQHADFKKGEDGVRSAANGVNPNVTIHRLYGAVRMDGKLYRVKVTLKEDVKSERSAKKAYSYEATKIELLAGTLVKPEGDDPNTNNSITAAKLLNGVEKSYDGGKFFEDYNKIREQFIGEKGAAAADHADEVNTRLDNLSVAREMEAEKKDAKAIKMATGWERGADGKWRYEVGDVRFYDGLQLINSSVKTEATLDDLLEDNKDKEALFASYPSLKNMPVVLEDMGYKGAGEYNYGKGTIRLNTYLLTDDEGYFTKPAVEILNHEIQHAIQKIEGFARGGSPAMVRSEIKKQMAEVTKQIRQLRAEGKEAEAKELIEKNRGLYEASVGDDDFGSYKSLAGEVESRNVESRMGMSAAERRASLAAETEDVSREDQIFLTSGDGGNANSEMLQETGTENDYSEFAKEHGVDADMVKDYALGMETGNLHKANFALTEIRRTMRVANRGMKLSEFGKLFRPVQKELAERYGDIEKLRQEHIDAEMRERGVMEAARKRAEEEAAKRKARADELRLLPEEELDRRYFEAVERGDDAAAREMLDEAARRKGYDDTESKYQGVGAWVAPSNPGYETDEARRDAVGEDAPDLNVEDMAAGYSNQPEDIFVHPDKYSQGLPTSKESGKAIQTAIDDIRNGKKEVKIKVYRAVPTSVKESKLRNGDWVTPSKEYAEMHGNNRLEGKYRIIEEEVPAGELWWDSNDVNEWGFDDGKGYKYKNVENSRKLNDLVTRDDNGEIIAPSKRFDQRKADERYHKVGTPRKPNSAEVALRDVLIEHMRGSGLDVIGTEDGQRVLDMANDDGAKEHRVYHGSGAEFDHFDHSHMGEGEGAQAYGWGTYVTEVKGIGEGYAIQNSEEPRTHYVYNGDTHGLSEERINEILEVLLDAGPSEGHIVSEYNDALGWYSGKRDEYCQYLAKDASLLNPSDISVVVDKTRNLYTVEIPEDNGKNYLDWNSETGKDLVSRLVSILRADKELKEAYEGRLSELNKELGKFAPRTLFSDTYVQLAELLGSDKKASQLLSSLGYVGIKYPADNLRGGRKDGAQNYVIFNENDAEITDHVRFFKTKNGEAYGFTVGGKIYYDPRIANAETPVHEYAHLWAEALRNGNAEEWKNVVELMKGTPVWNEVKARYTELKSDDEIADEVIATYSGRRGAERLREEQRKIADGDGSVSEKAAAISALERVKQALKKFWKAVADFLHIHYKSAEEVADRVMKDLLDGVDPRKFMGNNEKGFRFSAKQKRALETASLGNAPRSLTVVSSVTGAKVLNSIDKLVDSLEKSATQPKTFIGNVSKALGASRFGSGSEYATFETKNGDVVTIRLANHNAHVSGFDHNGKDNGISIVISPKPNEGITNDGNAHITEFYYDSIKLRRADGKPLADIVRSIKQALYSGEFKDTTGLAERQEVNGDDVIRFQLIGENDAATAEGLKDVVEKMKADVERLHEGELDDLRSGARAIGGRLSELNKAMRLQRAYDMSTVASVTELAKTMLKNGLLSEMSDYDVRRLLSVVNNVHGKGDIRPYVQKVVDMMVGNRLRNVSKAFDKLLAMRGKKVDARGVEVQGELDLAGQRMADVVWKGIGMSDDDVADMCADAQDRMMSANGAEAAAAATDYAGWQIVMHLGFLPYYNNLLAEYLASYTNTLQLIDCQYFTQCKILQISLAHNLHTPHAATRYKHGRRILRHRGAEKSVAPTDSSTSLWRKPHRIRPNRLRGSGVGCVRCMQGSV